MSLRLWQTIALAGLASIGGGCQWDRASRGDRVGLVEGDPRAELEIARALFSDGELDEAREAFERAIEINPTLPDGYLGIGDIAQQRGDLPAAEEAYASAARVAPQSFDAQYKHGLVLHLLSRLAEAVGAYVRALQIDPGDFEANLNLATAYLQLGEPAQGLIYASNAVEIDPRSGPARVNLAAIYGALGQWAEAAGQYEFASELTTLTPDLTVTLADAQLRAGKPDAALFTLEGLVERDPSANAFERLGTARFKVRDYEGAKEAFARAVELDGSNFPALNGLAVSRLNDYLRSDKRDERALDDARGHLRQSLRVNPNQPRVKELLTRFG